jgi:prefoldin subunit 5
MSDVQVDVNIVIESLTNQIAQQAQRIAMLEATINAIQKAKQEVGNADKAE